MIILTTLHWKIVLKSLACKTTLLKQWTDYLITDSLVPADQISTDDFAGSLANQTNLAIKGIIGIAAMGEISTLLGNSADASNYSVSLTTLTSAADPEKFHLVHCFGLRYQVPRLRHLLRQESLEARLPGRLQLGIDV